MMNAVKYQIEVDVGHTNLSGFFILFLYNWVSIVYKHLLFIFISATECQHSALTATRDSAYG